ncbi:hypothetical protein GOV03_02865 [Candidatus Woesearchaeota archaeon]|nr:hypothetical protein [Candidatus Woesearchaeota archaeon]
MKDLETQCGKERSFQIRLKEQEGRFCIVAPERNNCKYRSKEHFAEIEGSRGKKEYCRCFNKQ